MVLVSPVKKNIVIVVSAMNLGGAQRVVSILCDHWSQENYKVTLISTYTGSKVNHYQVSNDVSSLHLSDSKIFPKSRLINLIWKFIELRRLIRQLSPDVVISFLTRVNVATSLSTVGFNTRLIICERTWTPFATLNKKLFWFYRLLFKRADKVIVQTDKSKSWLNKNFPENSSTVIPNPVVDPLPLHNERSIKPDSLVDKDKRIILASGRMHKYKQFDLLIRAFNAIKDHHTQWELVILGEGEERLELKRLVDELEMSNRINLPGSVGNISEWYERADLFVLSSSVEGFPNVLLEAMTYGIPCVSFDCDTGPRDMIQNGINGLLVHPSEKELGLENALRKLISDKNLRLNISKNATLLREKYSVDNIMKQWDKTLDL